MIQATSSAPSTALSPSPTRRRWRPWATWAVMIALFLLGLVVRRAIYETQRPASGRSLPFTLESALQYRLARMVYTGEGIPTHDPVLFYPEGQRTFAVDTSGAEYFYGLAARLFPSSITLPERIRWLSVGWFCLAIPLLAWAVGRATGSRAAGVFAGVFYAVNLGAVVRSTGQELAHENFAIPWLMAHWAAEAEARHRAAAGRPAIRWYALSALAAAVALATWDLIQFYVVLRFIGHAVAWIRRPSSWRESAHTAWKSLGAGVLLAAAVSPYLRTHGFWHSPAMALLAGLTAGSLALGFPMRRPHPTPNTRARLFFLAATLLVLAFGWAYWSSYSHFGELLWAKIRFLNRKPVDPALLTFDQRIMWTPALHSANLNIFRTLFPYVAGLTLLGLVIWFSTRRRPDGCMCDVQSWWWGHLISLVSFILFVRFHVFFAITSAALAGWMAGWAGRRTGWRRLVLICGMIVVAIAELGHVVNDPARWGREEYYPQLDELGEWMKDLGRGEPVLANFATSPTVLTYGRCPVLMNPKFESPEARQRVETYANLLFKGSEHELRDWAEALGAQWHVYAMGEFPRTDLSRGAAARNEPDYQVYQMRYMVDALVPPPGAPARLFEYAPDQLKCFHLTCQNEKYRVFRLIPARDEREAAERLAEAEQLWQAGNAAGAAAAAARALMRNPCLGRAGEIIRMAAEKARPLLHPTSDRPRDTP